MSRTRLCLERDVRKLKAVSSQRNKLNKQNSPSLQELMLTSCQMSVQSLPRILLRVAVVLLSLTLSALS